MGRAGTGKSTRLLECWRDCTRGLVFDLLGAFGHGLVVSSPAEAVHWFWQEPRKFRVLFRPLINLSDRSAVFCMADWCCELARAIGPLELYLDELDAYASSSELPPNLDLLIRYGRHAGVTIRAAVRRPRAVVPRHFVTETTRLSIFRTVDPADRDFLKDFTGIDSDAMAALQPYHFFEWYEGRVTQRRVTRAGVSEPAIAPAAPSPSPPPEFPAA